MTGRIDYSAQKKQNFNSAQPEPRQQNLNQSKNLKLNSQRYGSNIIKVQPGLMNSQQIPSQPQQQ